MPVTPHLSQNALDALRKFADSANKSAPSHPLDQERWRSFVIIVYREGLDVPVDDLNEWLKQNGFPEEQADQLSIEFEHQRDILKAYAG